MDVAGGHCSSSSSPSSQETPTIHPPPTVTLYMSQQCSILYSPPVLYSLVILRLVCVLWTGRVAFVLVHHQVVIAARAVVGLVLAGSAVRLARHTRFVVVIWDRGFSHFNNTTGWPFSWVILLRSPSSTPLHHHHAHRHHHHFHRVASVSRRRGC